jgi:hypothetical protein
MPQDASFVDSRDAMLAADMLRFDGANQNEMWTPSPSAASASGRPALRRRRQRRRRCSATTSRPDRLDSPLTQDEALQHFRAPQGVTDMQGLRRRHEARATPVADSIRATDAGDTASFAGGPLPSSIAQPRASVPSALTLDTAPGQKRAGRAAAAPAQRPRSRQTPGPWPPATGRQPAPVIDDTEETNWASRTSTGTASEGKGEGAQVEGRQVTVDLAGDDAVNVTEVQLSAVLNGGCTADVITGQCPEDDEDLPSEDPGVQNRFSGCARSTC